MSRPSSFEPPRFPLRIRNPSLFAVLSVVVMMALSAVAILHTARRADGSLRQDLLRQARVVALGLNPARIARLSGTEADLTSEDYLRIKEQLARVRTGNPACRFLYLMGQRPAGEIFFFVDSEPAGSEDESPPGQTYEEASPGLRSVFAERRALVEGPFADRWGTWISAFVPLGLTEASGPPVVLGMDVASGNWRLLVAEQAAPPVLLVLLAAGLGLFLIGLRRAHGRVLKSQQKLEAIFRGAPVGIGVLVRRVFTEVNDRLCELTGFRRDELLGQSTRMIYPDDQEFERVGRDKYREMAQRGLGVVETKLRRNDGAILDIILSSAPLDSSNPDRGVAFAALDISERRRSMRELQRSEERFRQVAESAGEWIWEVDDCGLYTYASPAVETMLGYTPDELVGRVHFYDLFSPEQRESFKVKVLEAFARKEPIRAFVNANLHKDGRTVFLQTSASPILDEQGRLMGYRGADTDITEPLRTEQELRVQDAYLQELFDGAPEAIVVLDNHDVVQRINREFTRLFGYAPEEAVGHPINDLIVPDDLKKEGSQATDDVLRGKVVNIETVRESRHGERITVSILGNPIRLGGDQIGVYGIYRDIRQRVRAEEERIRLQGQLVQAQKMESVGRLAGGVAHDFNNMLQVVLGHVEMAMGRLKPGDPVREDLEEVRLAARRSADLTRQLLAFARKQMIQPRVLNLSETVEGMLGMLRRLIGEDITLLWKPGPGLWKVRLDPSQVDQVLANLCVNARDAIEGVGEVIIETGNVEVEEGPGVRGGARAGSYVRLTVSDTGSGMDEEVRAHVFEPFYTTKEVGEGTGLGLATVHGIVTQNEGFVEVYSEVGVGTTIKIYLPRHGEAEEGEAEEEKGGEALMGRGERVMLVEDDGAILRMEVRMLKGLGYEVVAAGSPEAAVRLVEEGQTIDLLVTDVVMPGMHGRELARRVSELMGEVKTLYVSGYTADVIARRGMVEAGMNFLQKPFTMEELAAKMREALEG